MGDTTHCVVFAHFPGSFLGPIFLITQVDCWRTSAAKFLSQRVATSGFLRKGHFQVCRVARTGENRMCSCSHGLKVQEREYNYFEQAAYAFKVN